MLLQHLTEVNQVEDTLRQVANQEFIRQECHLLNASRSVGQFVQLKLTLITVYATVRLLRKQLDAQVWELGARADDQILTNVEKFDLRRWEAEFVDLALGLAIWQPTDPFKLP